MKTRTLILACCLITAVCGCRQDEDIVKSTPTHVDDGSESTSAVAGFFLLNEGNMGSNKASIDYYDTSTGIYTKNIYAERNPGVVQELGDVGNDMQVYGDKLYAVINCSHFVEVMNVNNAKHITQISIPNCRYIAFSGKYAYISSYAGPVQIDPNARLGYVAKVDTATLQVVDTCNVGYQPDELVVSGNKLYVANSGGYKFLDYDNTVSVIDLNTFKEIKKIPVAINLHRLEADKHGNIYVSSRGDYYKQPSGTYILNTQTEQVDSTFSTLANTEMTLSGDSLYLYGTEFSYITNSWNITYAILNTVTRKVVSRSFITDGTEKQIQMPYGIAVNPETKEIYVTDAKNYVTPGTLYCFTPKGTLKWSVTTGDIPAHFAFTHKKLKPLVNQ